MITYLTLGIISMATNVTAFTASVEVRGTPKFDLLEHFDFRIGLQRDGTLYEADSAENTVLITDLLTVEFERVVVPEDGVPDR